MNYLHLTKPRSISLLLVAALAGLVMAAPGLPSLPVVILTLLGGALAAGGANTLNCYLDRDLDQRMARTAGRPLALGQIEPWRALAFGLLLCTSSVALFAAGVNRLSAGLAVAGVLYYVVVYTLWLKRASPWNVVVGGGAGALPLLVGWSAATGTLSPGALWLGAVVFFWTPPHFWSLALLRQREYAAAGVPMLPVVQGAQSTRRQILLYSVLLLVLTLLPPFAGFSGPRHLLPAAVLGGVLVLMSIRLLVTATNLAAWQLYRYSIAYLALLFVAMIVDHACQ